MQVTICGGGNAAHVLAGLLGSQRGLSVHVYTPYDDEVERWQDGLQRNGGITVTTRNGQVFGRPSGVSRDPAEAVPDSKLVLLALPAFAHEATLAALAPHLSPGTWVGALPARGGFDLCTRATLSGAHPDIVIFGLQTLPWACRVQQYGQEVTILGAKERVDMTVWPPTMAPEVLTTVQSALGVALDPISSFLSLTLADTGQLIHPGIMYGLFHEWDGQPYPHPRLFYQGVDAGTAEILEQMSHEVQLLRAALEGRYPGLDLSAVRPLREWLEHSYRAAIEDPGTLQSSFVSNRSYAGLLAPMQRSDGGFIPNFESRYLAEDVPFGLLVTRGIAELAGIKTPVIDQVLVWAQDRLKSAFLVAGRIAGSGLGGTRCPQRYGFDSLEALVRTMQYPVHPRHGSRVPE